MNDPSRTVGVIGAGSWGTALAAVLAKKGHRVSIWAREPEVVRDIQEVHENRTFLPDARLPRSLEASTRLQDVVADKEMVLSVVPSQFVASVFGSVAEALHPEVQVVSASKGIEVSTGKRMDEVLSGFLSPEQAHRLTFLSGPSFAKEVAEEQPTAATEQIASAGCAPSRRSISGFTPTRTCWAWSWGEP